MFGVMGTSKLWPAPEVAEVAERLIASVPEHGPLRFVDLRFVYTPKTWKVARREKAGSARRLTGFEAHMAGWEPGDKPIGVVKIAWSAWEVASPAGREALVDHELSHFLVEVEDGEAKLHIVGHDVEEFTGVVERHGLWSADLPRFAAAVGEQLRLWPADSDASPVG